MRGLPHPPEPPPPGVIRREVPGALAQTVKGGAPFHADSVLSEFKTPPAADGTHTRAFVVEGLDPGAYIRVEEIYAPGVEDAVKDWKFMFADGVRARLAPQADTPAMAAALRALGWRLRGLPDKDGWVLIALNSHTAASVPIALKQLQEWPQWVAEAGPDYLPPPKDRRE
jgi:hypothetical protein